MQNGTDGPLCVFIPELFEELYVRAAADEFDELLIGRRICITLSYDARSPALGALTELAACG